MRAVICRDWGTPADLEVAEIAPPPMRANGVRIRVAAAGINFADTVMIQGRYQGKPPLPCCPGLEVAGEVIEVADGVTRCKPGDRVFAAVDFGGYAEEAMAEAAYVWQIPDGMDMVNAAGFTIVYGTSHLALTDRSNLRAGETLVVHGAAGGVGLTAVEIGKKIGAMVIATAGSQEKLEVAAKYGADHLINYSHEDVRERIKDLTDGRGADVIYDPVGGSVFDASLRAIAWNGRIVIIGFASGTVPQVPANILLVKHVGVLGFYWGSYKDHCPEVITASIDEMLGWYVDGALKPRVSMTFDLADAAQAMEALLARKSTGKIVLTTGA